MSLILIDATTLNKQPHGGIHRCIRSIINESLKITQHRTAVLNSNLRVFLALFLYKSNIPLFYIAPAQRILCIPNPFRAKIIKILVVHDLTWKLFPSTQRRIPNLIDRIVFPLSLKRADMVVTVSETTRIKLIELYPWVADKTRLGYPNLPESLRKRTPQNAQLLPYNDYALFVGTIEPRKNLPFLISAFKQFLSKSNSDFSLIIAGAEGWGPKVDFSGCKNIVHFPEVDDGTLSLLYENCKFVINLSLYEGFGLPILEALTYEKACIVSKDTSLAEVAELASLKVDPTSIDEASRSIYRLYKNTRLRTALENNSIIDLRRLEKSRIDKIMKEILSTAWL